LIEPADRRRLLGGFAAGAMARNRAKGLISMTLRSFNQAFAISSTA
jgi:hypothetical protein